MSAPVRENCQAGQQGERTRWFDEVIADWSNFLIPSAVDASTSCERRLGNDSGSRPARSLRTAVTWSTARLNESAPRAVKAMAPRRSEAISPQTQTGLPAW